MNISKNKIFLGVITGFILGNFPVLAYDGATLSEIEINPYNESNYQFVLKTDKKIPIQKIIVSDNKIILKLKHIRPAGFVNTVYNTSSINNIIIQPSSNDEVKIYIDGKNAAQSYISLETAESGLDFIAPVQSVNPESLTKTDIEKTDLNETNKIKTSQPKTSSQTNNETLNTNKPASFNNIEEQIPENIIQVNAKPDFKPAIVMNESTQNKEELNKEQSTLPLSLLKKLFSGSLIDNVIRILALLIILIGAFKALKPKQKNIHINLNANKNIKEKEMDLYKHLSLNRGLIGGSIKSSYDKDNILKRNTSSTNYGLNEYKNSQVAPKTMGLKSPSRLSPEDIGFKPSLSHDFSLGVNRTKNSKASINTQTRQPASRITKNDINSAKVNIDNVKFLETMAGIYEKSGRTDLASGIQSSLNKTNRAM